ncbi:hypothetical protein F5Y02DRAFT_406046 [Annulohypoxylon stygium]|nr:hypothetical protein F5Y02DRAFT_406046 [Annulohypoxylon stygium]
MLASVASLIYIILVFHGLIRNKAVVSIYCLIVSGHLIMPCSNCYIEVGAYDFK